MAAQAAIPSAQAVPLSPRISTSDFQRLADQVRTAAPRPQLEVVSPLTGELLGTIPLCIDEDVEAAFAGAREAQKAWAALSLRERTAPFKRLHDMVLERRETLMDINQLENGKARISALEEVFDVALNARHYAYHAARYIGPKRVQSSLPPLIRSVEVYQPFGVVGEISPWNFPLNLAISDAIPALIAGNAVVLKPSELTPYSALMALNMLRECGLPEHVFQIVTGDGPGVGTAIIDRADMVMFTGSTKTGRAVAERCADRLIPCTLELGGKNPVIVLDDAHLKRAVNSVLDSTVGNTGQMCVSFERLYVHDAVYDRFVPELARRMREVKLGKELEFGAQMGSLISKMQFEKVKAHVDDAVAKGARVLAGGRPRPDLGPYFFEATLIEGVTPEMMVYGEETFGPLLSVYRFKTDDEAVALSNDSPYGLNAAVFSKNLRRARHIAERIETGTVSINEGYKAMWGSTAAVQGGVKLSGIGRRHGREGIAKFTQSKQISSQHLLSVAPGGKFTQARFDKLFATALWWMRRIPGLR